MDNELRIEQEEDHIGGNFKWEIEPKCRCGRMVEAVNDKFVFVSNFTEEDYNQFYMLPVAADGTLFREKGLPISYCPWCGDKIKGRKKYPS